MFLRYVLTVSVVTALVSFGVTARAESPPSAKALESRLYAPCCYGGTLDIHESELARELRKEIESRIARGDSVDVIQADFVDRYGEKVLAARSDKPAQTMGVVLVALMLIAGAGLAVVLRRWTRKGPSDASTRDGATAPPVRDELDARLDAELADLDG